MHALKLFNHSILNSILRLTFALLYHDTFCLFVCTDQCCWEGARHCLRDTSPGLHKSVLVRCALQILRFVFRRFSWTTSGSQTSCSSSTGQMYRLPPLEHLQPTTLSMYSFTKHMHPRCKNALQCFATTALWPVVDCVRVEHLRMRTASGR